MLILFILLSPKGVERGGRFSLGSSELERILKARSSFDWAVQEVRMLRRLENWVMIWIESRLQYDKKQTDKTI